MKVLHAAVSLNPSAGVVRQMTWEDLAARRLGLPWTVRLATLREIQSPVVAHMGRSGGTLRQYVSLRLDFYRWLRSVADRYDAVLLRHSVHDALEAHALATLGNVWSVHHTLEVPELRTGRGPAARLRAAAEACLGRQCLRHVRGIVAVTREIADYELRRAGAALPPTRVCVYPNGVWYGDPVVEDARGKPAEMLFAAHDFAPWHGLDLLVAAVRRCREPFVLHVVGRLTPALASAARADARIRLHDTLDPAGIRGLAARCAVGISSLATHRNAMAEACPLKAREYLLLGLPVYGAYRDSGLPQDFPFYRQGPVEMEAMLGFASAMQRMPRPEIAAAARPWVDKVAVLARLYRQSALAGEAASEFVAHVHPQTEPAAPSASASPAGTEVE